MISLTLESIAGVPLLGCMNPQGVRGFISGSSLDVSEKQSKLEMFKISLNQHNLNRELIVSEKRIKQFNFFHGLQMLKI